MKLSEFKTSLILLGFVKVYTLDTQWKHGDLEVIIFRQDYISVAVYDIRRPNPHKTFSEFKQGSDAPKKALDYIVKILDEYND